MFKNPGGPTAPPPAADAHVYLGTGNKIITQCTVTYALKIIIKMGQYMPFKYFKLEPIWEI